MQALSCTGSPSFIACHDQEVQGEEACPAVLLQAEGSPDLEEASRGSLGSPAEDRRPGLEVGRGILREEGEMACRVGVGREACCCRLQEGRGAWGVRHGHLA